MSSTFIQIIGIIAGSITAVSMLPQLLKVIKEKKAANISIGMLLTLMTGLVLWMVYGFFIQDNIIIVTNLFSLVINGILLTFRIKYKNN